MINAYGRIQEGTTVTLKDGRTALITYARHDTKGRPVVFYRVDNTPQARYLGEFLNEVRL